MLHWGKACKTKNGYALMSLPVRCKDYLVDIHFKTSTFYNKKEWTYKQQEEVCYYLLQINSKTFTENVKYFLNRYEKKMRIRPTTVEVCTYNKKKLCIVHSSSVWGRTCIMRSHYLTMLRLCTSKTLLTSTPFKWEDFPYTPDVGYYKKQKPDGKKVLAYIMDNPRELLNFSYTGYKKDTYLGHGHTGYFRQLQLMEYYKKTQMYEHLVSLNFKDLYNKIVKGNTK